MVKLQHAGCGAKATVLVTRLTKPKQNIGGGDHQSVVILIDQFKDEKGKLCYHFKYPKNGSELIHALTQFVKITKEGKEEDFFDEVANMTSNKKCFCQAKDKMERFAKEDGNNKMSLREIYLMHPEYANCNFEKVDEDQEAFNLFIQNKNNKVPSRQGVGIKEKYLWLKAESLQLLPPYEGKTRKIGFCQSDANPCLFISPTVICLVYVDGALLFYRDHEAVEDLAKGMKQEQVDFNVESNVAGHLGKDITPVKTPADDSYLPINKLDKPVLGLYNYASVVGMLNDLQGHSRVEISFAVSQVVRYVHTPKRSYKLALEAAIPLMAVSSSINEGLGLGCNKLLTFRATKHEDNLSVLSLAQLEPGSHTPRSKFYTLKLHWWF
eukprot:jgi/Psemu1/33035/gm1.33035_g